MLNPTQLLSRALTIVLSLFGDGTPPTVALDAAIVNGINNQGSPSQSFLGIPFASAPRFALPEPIKTYTGTLDASKYGPACIQQDLMNTATPTMKDVLKHLNLTFPPVLTNQSEDCLSINVIRPASATLGSKLPVVVWLYGGGFMTGGSSTWQNMGTALVEKSIEKKEDIMFVSFNYRVSAYGFLAGKAVKDAGVANVGIWDQREALDWVHRYIANFGGDPGRVILWGQSAGGASASAHTLINGGDTGGLFHGVFAQSGPILPLGPVDSDKGQSQFESLANAVDCKEGNDAEKLKCLRSRPLEKLRTAVDATNGFFAISSSALEWHPWVDEKLFSDNPFKLVQQGKFARVPVVTGNVDDEGTIFTLAITGDVFTPEETIKWIKTYTVPTLSDGDEAEFNKWYPNDGGIAGSPFDTPITDTWKNNTQYKRAAAWQGDMVFQAPRRYLASHISNQTNTWVYLSTQRKERELLGSWHSSDVNTMINYYPFLEYVAKFAKHLDPNIGGDAVQWPRYNATDPHQYLFPKKANPTDKVFPPPTVIKDDHRIGELRSSRDSLVEPQVKLIHQEIFIATGQLPLRIDEMVNLKIINQLSFPGEVWSRIFLRLDYLSLAAIRLTCKEFHTIINESPRNLAYFHVKKLENNYGYMLAEEQSLYTVKELEGWVEHRQRVLNIWSKPAPPEFRARSFEGLGIEPTYPDYEFLPGGRWLMYSSRRDPNIRVLDVEAVAPNPQPVILSDSSVISQEVLKSDSYGFSCVYWIDRSESQLTFLLASFFNAGGYLRTRISRVQLCGHGPDATFDVQPHATFRTSVKGDCPFATTLNDAYLISFETYASTILRITNYSNTGIGSKDYPRVHSVTYSAFDGYATANFIYGDVLLLLGSHNMKICEVVDTRLVTIRSIKLSEDLSEWSPLRYRPRSSQIQVIGEEYPLTTVTFYHNGDEINQPTILHHSSRDREDIMGRLAMKRSFLGISSSLTYEWDWSDQLAKDFELIGHLYDPSSSTLKTGRIPIRLPPSPLNVVQVGTWNEETGRLVLVHADSRENPKSVVLTLLETRRSQLTSPYAMSTDLQWLLLRQNNSYIVKRVPEGPVFSKEPGNLRNLHSHKYSGLANSKTIDISESNGTVNIVTRKAKASPQAVTSAYATSHVRARSGGRRALGVAAGLAKRGYRPDLRTAALARVSALAATQKEPKAAKAKKVRGKKAAASS
ncbi:hypothetical protein NP233_g4192 [Leucocoprinus birnbaumii]|uniref:F-box domain-containing protein n=1 Tax=Leucocoprinus birnbaumii TaxID=56174 RepID=A0AAD5YVR6_9AGAR|nr:hypothetical protein NP233_g4192 [Leucocoprinus birnbaumii]